MTTIRSHINSVERMLTDLSQRKQIPSEQYIAMCLHLDAVKQKLHLPETPQGVGLTPWQREQVEATYWILERAIGVKNDNKEIVLANLTNLVLSCMYFDEYTREAITRLLALTSEEGIIAFVQSNPIGVDVVAKQDKEK